MVKRLIAVFSALLAFASFARPIVAADSSFRALRMHQILEAYHSPMSGHEEALIASADKYHLDWTLLAAVAGTESSFGLHMPYTRAGQPCINPYGWGVYGDNLMCFDSYEAAADQVAAGLAKGYNTTSLHTIARTYNTVSTDAWEAHTQYFIDRIKNAPIPVSVLPITL